MFESENLKKRMGPYRINLGKLFTSVPEMISIKSEHRIYKLAQAGGSFLNLNQAEAGWQRQRGSFLKPNQVEAS